MFWALQQDSISLRVRVGVKTVVYVGIGTFVFLCVWSFFLAKNRQKKYFVLDSTTIQLPKFETKICKQ